MGGPRFDRREAPGRECPNCPSRGLVEFYSLDPIPVQSCVLMRSRAEALELPRAPLTLGFCPACGFVTNTAFDPAFNRYDQLYEETQGFSPTFGRFAKELASRYVERYDLGRKTTLEIGCGKGEFLALLCELSGGRGIGIDPGYVPGRTASPAVDRIRFIVDLYDRRYADLEADFIVCRHTLEHIGPTRTFMEELRRTIGPRTGVSLFFELPDVLRVLREGAFWDIYYEHASYFTPGSLARLFRSTGFDVTGLTLEYDGQYLILDASPAPGPTPPRFPIEDDLADVRAAVEAFPAACERVASHWTTFLGAARARGERTVVWGSGSKGVGFLTTLGLGEEVAAAVDINPYRQGRFMPGSGHEIVAPSELRRLRPEHVIVMNPVYVPEISAMCAELGVTPAIHALS
jgi:SAM-dependent methyltransferase